LTTKFRPIINIIKTAAQLALNEGGNLVEARHIKAAVAKHCKTIHQQIIEHHVGERGAFLEIEPEGESLGSIYGLAVVADGFSGEKTGTILKVNAFMHKKNLDDLTKGFYKVTGVARDSRWIDDSIAKVRTVIMKRHHVDIAQHYFTHIDFAQSHGVDGPSAGVTMTLLISSLLMDCLLRQDVAVTGEINIGPEDEVKVTAVSGLYEKIRSAETWGFRKVLIPQKNLEHSINPDDFEIEVVGCANLVDYLRHILADDEGEGSGAKYNEAIAETVPHTSM
ncbi:MAG: hypothetical protein PVJ38_06195, partial [Candidatus Bathyarchaeota archaeon]